MEYMCITTVAIGHISPQLVRRFPNEAKCKTIHILMNFLGAFFAMKRVCTYT